MGRRKIEIQPISDDRNRSVTFLKRKNGLMKKAFELGVLCGADVAVIVFAGNGKLYEFSSGDLNGTLLRYSNHDHPPHEHRGPADYNGTKAKGKAGAAAGAGIAGGPGGRHLGGGDDDEDDDDEEGGDASDATGIVGKGKTRAMDQQGSSGSPTWAFLGSTAPTTTSSYPSHSPYGPPASGPYDPSQMAYGLPPPPHPYAPHSYSSYPGIGSHPSGLPPFYSFNGMHRGGAPPPPPGFPGFPYGAPAYPGANQQPGGGPQAPYAASLAAAAAAAAYWGGVPPPPPPHGSPPGANVSSLMPPPGPGPAQQPRYDFAALAVAAAAGAGQTDLSAYHIGGGGAGSQAQSSHGSMAGGSANGRHSASLNGVGSGAVGRGTLVDSSSQNLNGSAVANGSRSSAPPGHSIPALSNISKTLRRKATDSANTNSNTNTQEGDDRGRPRARSDSDKDDDDDVVAAAAAAAAASASFLPGFGDFALDLDVSGAGEGAGTGKRIVRLSGRRLYLLFRDPDIDSEVQGGRRKENGQPL